MSSTRVKTFYNISLVLHLSFPASSWLKPVSYDFSKTDAETFLPLTFVWLAVPGKSTRLSIGPCCFPLPHPQRGENDGNGNACLPPGLVFHSTDFSPQ